MRFLNNEHVLGAFTIGMGAGGLLTKYFGSRANSFAIIGLAGLYMIYDIIEIRDKDSTPTEGRDNQ